MNFIQRKYISSGFPNYTQADSVRKVAMREEPKEIDIQCEPVTALLLSHWRDPHSFILEHGKSYTPRSPILAFIRVASYTHEFQVCAVTLHPHSICKACDDGQRRRQGMPAASRSGTYSHTALSPLSLNITHLQF